MCVASPVNCPPLSRDGKYFRLREDRRTTKSDEKLETGRREDAVEIRDGETSRVDVPPQRSREISHGRYGVTAILLHDV